MEKIKLGECATFINGYAFKPSDWKNIGIPIIRIQNLTGSMKNENFFDGVIDEKYKIRKGDVLISWSGSLGVYEWKREDAYLNQHIFKVEFNKVDIDKNYFIYLIKSKLNDMKKNTHGSTMKHITKSNFEKIEINLHSIEEQKKISSRLVEIYKIINLKKKQINELDEFIKSQFVEMFGIIENSKFNKEKIELLVDRNIISIKKKYNKTDEIEYIDISSINKEKNIIEGTTNYVVSEAPSRAQQCLIKNDILISTVRPNLKNIAVYKMDLCNAVSSSGFCVLRCNEKLNNYYLFNVINTNKFTTDMVLKTTGSNYPAIRDKDILEYYIPVPPIELQNQFAEIVKQIDKQKFEIEASLKETETLYETLMAKYFE